MVAARRDVVNADSSETAGPDSAHPKTASDKTMGASKATKKGSSMYKLDEGRSPFTDLAIGVLPQLEAVKLETPRAARASGRTKRTAAGPEGAYLAGQGTNGTNAFRQARWGARPAPRCAAPPRPAAAARRGTPFFSPSANGPVPCADLGGARWGEQSWER